MLKFQEIQGRREERERVKELTDVIQKNVKLSLYIPFVTTMPLTTVQSREYLSLCT